jgi:hypothetical protein
MFGLNKLADLILEDLLRMFATLQIQKEYGVRMEVVSNARDLVG